VSPDNFLNAVVGLAERRSSILSAISLKIGRSHPPIDQRIDARRSAIGAIG